MAFDRNDRQFMFSRWQFVVANSCSCQSPPQLLITPMMREILERRCVGLAAGDELFKGVSAEHVHTMALRIGAPRFMLHDLRKLVATVGENLELGDAVLKRILNHTAPKTDVLHRH